MRTPAPRNQPDMSTATRRIASLFAAARAEKRRALIGYLTAGDPDLPTSERDLRTAIENGVDLLELGVPFSDPTADGPTIQAAGQRALRAGVNLHGVLDLATRLRRDFFIPLVLFSYANPLLNYGFERLCADAAAAGLDGLLVVDLPFEEAGELRALLKARGLALIQLIAPTTPLERARAILAQADGFVYYILVKGVTGARDQFDLSVGAHLAELRRSTRLPLAVGFGISNAAQARAAAGLADAVVVGSALVQAARAGRLAPLVRELAAAVRAP